MIDNGDKLPFPKAHPRERVDILTFVVTKAGWEALKDRIGISSSNSVRILTRLIHESAIELLDRAGIDWRHLPNNHAKVILYRKQKIAVLGSFNLTEPSLSDNIECLYRIDDAYYERLAGAFEGYWMTAHRDEDAIVPLGMIAQAMTYTLDDSKEMASDQEAPDYQAKLVEGPLEPWPFQEKIIHHVMTWLGNAPDTSIGRIIKLPTGAGKTLIAGEIIRRLIKQKPQVRILWVCHRVELLRQSWKSIYRQINGSIPETAWFVPQHIKDASVVRDLMEFPNSKSCQMVFCTQGMLPHLLTPNRQNPFDLAIIDECHRFHPQSKTYRTLYKYCRGKTVPRLGLTATPLPQDKLGFGQYWNTEDIFGKEVTTGDLEQKGFLSRLHPKLTRRWKTNHVFAFSKHVEPQRLEYELVTRIGEFNNDEVNGAVAKAWKEYHDKRQRILCFAVTTKHADTLKKRFFLTDDCVRVVHSQMEYVEVCENLEWFKHTTPEPRMLVSVLMLTEGIDMPKTDCLFMARPTFSPELYQQMIGRGFRGPKADGTEDCAVVDFTSQYVDQNGQVLPFKQVTTNDIEGPHGTASQGDEEPDDLDASGKISTVGDLRKAVDDLVERTSMSRREACEKLAPEMDYSANTLANYYSQKPENYPLGWEDSEQLTDDSAAGERCVSRKNVTTNNLLDLRLADPRRFEEIASLTNVASNTLQSYCSNPEQFERWKDKNKDKMEQVRVILSEYLLRFPEGGQRWPT